MTDGLFESISQKRNGAETAENARILEVSNELHKRCQLYETQLRNG